MTTVEGNGLLRSVAETIKNLLRNEAHDVATSRYQVGVSVNVVRKDDAAFGKGAVKMLASEVGIKQSQLYAFGEVAETWTEEEFRELIAQRGTDGKTLTFSHFTVLFRKGKEKLSTETRDALLREALEMNLSVRDLAKRLSELAPSSSPTPSKVVASRARAVHAACAALQQLVKALESFGFDDAAPAELEEHREASKLLEKLNDIYRVGFGHEDARSDAAE